MCFSSSREVITIQKFLEAAARQETCGKVRIQRFIENLLRRIALAERLVEYYQVNGSPSQCNHYKVHTHKQGQSLTLTHTCSNLTFDLSSLLQQHQQPTDNGPHRITKSRRVSPLCGCFTVYE